MSVAALASAAPTNTLTDADLILTLERSGEFSVRWTHDNTNQCGPNQQTDILAYSAKLIMQGTNLDQDGFVVDNMFVHKYFQTTYHLVETFVSCERIAMKTCRDLKALLGERLLGVEVTISGMPQAKLTAQCTFPAPRFAGET